MLSEEYPEWKALLTEVLADIAKRLTSIADYTSFRGVCTSWRCAATFHNFDRQFPRAPLLLYFLEETEEEEEETEIPVLGDALSEVSEETRDALSEHFMLGISIKLPSFPLFDVFISKMVLSGSPMEEESGLVVMVIWGFDDQLAFCRPGDECWTLMDPWKGYFYDIIYHDRKLYALDTSLSIVEYDIYGSNPTKIVKVFAIPPDDFIKDRSVIQKFLVESFGKFLLVLQYMSKHFRIYEIELKKDGSCSYKEIDNMGDRCLFLGLNSSICVSSSTVEALKPNCIYFSNRKPSIWEPYVGVYTLGGDGDGDGDGHFQDFSAMFDFCFPPPVWVVPTI